MNYIITFNDNTEFKGDSYIKGHWNTMPDKPIIKMAYYTMDKLSIRLDKMEYYNHIVERAYLVLGTAKLPPISKIIIMGKNKKGIIKYTFDFINIDINKEIINDCRDMEFNKYTGWKRGDI